MSKDFVAGFTFACLLMAIAIIALMWLGRAPDDDDAARQPVTDESKWGDLTDDEREKLRKAG